MLTRAEFQAALRDQNDLRKAMVIGELLAAEAMEIVERTSRLERACHRHRLMPAEVNRLKITERDAGAAFYASDENGGALPVNWKDGDIAVYPAEFYVKAVWKVRDDEEVPEFGVVVQQVADSLTKDQERFVLALEGASGKKIEDFRHIRMGVRRDICSRLITYGSGEDGMTSRGFFMQSIIGCVAVL